MKNKLINIILIQFILFFGCSKLEFNQDTNSLDIPNWYLQPPQSDEYIYSTGTGTDRRSSLMNALKGLIPNVENIEKELLSELNYQHEFGNVKLNISSEWDKSKDIFHIIYEIDYREDEKSLYYKSFWY